MDRILQRCMEVLCTVSLTVRIVGTVTSAAASTVHSYSGVLSRREVQARHRP